MADINIAYLELRLSGGAANTDPSASLGGVMSSQIIRSKSVSGLTNISGVVIDDAPGSPDGAGILTWTASTDTLTWAPFGGSAGTGVVVTTAGKYAIPGSSGYLFVTIADPAALPATDQTDTLAVAQLSNQLFDDISRIESYNGDSEYRCMYVYNAHPTDGFIGAKVYIYAQPNGADKLDIGLDPAGLGDGVTTGVAATVANEGTAPNSVSFSRPAVIGSAISLGEIAAGQGRALWQKRTVPAQTYTPTLVDLSSLVFNVGY